MLDCKTSYHLSRVLVNDFVVDFDDVSEERKCLDLGSDKVHEHFLVEGLGQNWEKRQFYA